MPRRTDIESILIVGAGPIVIGQACEFDYSGTQACRALKSEGYRIVLVNSNPATIMTDPDLADATYVEPVTPEFVARIVEKERPDALLPTMGGQTGLNTALAVADAGVLDAHGVEMIGADRDAIRKAEDRELFRAAMANVGLECPPSLTARSLDEARPALDGIGLPLIVRPSFTLGGTGSGVARDREEFERVVAGGLEASPISEVLIERSVLGWKEYEMEVVRDRNDNCIVVCSIENVDPMGVHTGDSITVAPALTLTDKEYQAMRNASIAVLREIGVETGGSNVQFAVDPASGRLVVIEMNPRVSRSSALASKATGFPIAKVAARLAVGYTLDELDNDITGVTPASFEPAIDYVVTKMPRFAFEKFPGAPPRLTTSMKSVGETMSIGRCFAESLQKALRSTETGLTGLDEVAIPGAEDPAAADTPAYRTAVAAALAEPAPERPLAIAQALRAGFAVGEIHGLTGYDPWFIDQIRAIVDAEAGVRAAGLPATREGLLRLKRMGFSDARLAGLSGLAEPEVAAARSRLGVRPVFKRVDTCAAEYESRTPYMYSTYESDAWLTPGREAGAESEARPSDRTKVIVLGGGPNRIGQGIEFDYCCCHAARALAEAGHETVMVNCNPETVSTDYDTSDRLYFEPLTVEDVLEIVRVERSRGSLLGVIVQFGGQTPLKLAQGLAEVGVPILGTSPDAIDLAEDRERFQRLLARLGLRQPANGTATGIAEAREIAASVGYPVLIRPSYVLGGWAMEIVRDGAALERYMRAAVAASGAGPVLIDAYLRDAIEVDVDALCDGADVFVAGVMEHIEEAGVHSGDSACVLPPHTLAPATLDDIHRQTAALARELGVVGAMNVQYAVKGEDVYVLEVNPRASRSVPFVAKATGRPIAGIAARVMAGAKLEDLIGEEHGGRGGRVAVKEAVFPFARFPAVDVVLGPEMRSTGEVMGIDVDFARAFAKSQLAAGVRLPESGTVFISVKNDDKAAMVAPARRLRELGYGIVATGGTARFLRSAGVACGEMRKVLEGSPHVVDAIANGEIALVFNTTGGARAVSDSASLRRAAVAGRVPYYTTVAGARAAVRAMETLRAGGLDVGCLQSGSAPPA